MQCDASRRRLTTHSTRAELARMSSRTWMPLSIIPAALIRALGCFLKGKVMTPILLGLLLVLPPNIPSTLSGTQSRSFNPSGYFIPNQSQRNSSKVRWILLSDYYESGRSGPLYVELRIGTEKRWMTFSQYSLNIVEDRVTFKTKARKGESYEFQGQFFPSKRENQLGHFDDSHNATTVLRGELKIKRGNRVIMSEVISFYYTVGD